MATIPFHCNVDFGGEVKENESHQLCSQWVVGFRCYFFLCRFHSHHSFKKIKSPLQMCVYNRIFGLSQFRNHRHHKLHLCFDRRVRKNALNKQINFAHALYLSCASLSQIIIKRVGDFEVVSLYFHCFAMFPRNKCGLFIL